MSTPVEEIHNFLQQQTTVDSSPDNVTKNDEDYVLGVELIVAFTASRFLNIESFIPEKIIAVLGTNNFLVSLVWLLILFFGLRHFVAKEYQKRHLKK